MFENHDNKVKVKKPVQIIILGSGFAGLMTALLKSKVMKISNRHYT